MRTFARTWSLAVVLASAAPAFAQNKIDDAASSAARTLGYEGVAAYQAGDYDAAADKLNRAFSVAKVPTMGLWLARALVKTGKLVQASERYAEVAQLDANVGQVKTQKKAQADAATERASLLPRIPNVRIVVDGAEPDQVTVTVDGVLMPSVLIGIPRPVDPGKRTIVVKRGSEVKTVEVSLSEGQEREVTFDLQASEDGSLEAPDTAATPAPSDKAARSETPVAQADAARGSGWQPTTGWIALGVGTAAVAAGAITGVMALSNYKKASGACPNDACPTDAWDHADSVNSLRTVSTVGFIVGAVGLGAGATLLLTVPKPGPTGWNVTPWVGFGATGLSGTF